MSPFHGDLLFYYFAKVYGKLGDISLSWLLITFPSHLKKLRSENRGFSKLVLLRGFVIVICYNIYEV